jgi:hypothetical protein
MGDSEREIRSMILAAFPCPPLPLLVLKETNSEMLSTDNLDKEINSHDMIAHFMQVAMR